MISIELPNFFNSDALNTLKERMGIDRHTYGKFGDSQDIGTRIQLETTGVEVKDLSDIVPLGDYTLSYNGKRIILYIRDVNDWGDSDKLPKFHVSICSTVQSMIDLGKKKKYVVSNSESDVFQLNFINGKSVREVEHPLSVCKNCLETLRWNDYSKSWSYDKKTQCVTSFQVKEFFSKYPKSLIDEKGFSNKNSLLNQYPSNWKKISRDYREFKNWICEQCGVNLTHQRRLLQTHHINSLKNENNYSNLKALCVYCHANQPMHGHMYNNPQTSKDIQEIFKIRKKQGIS